MNIAEFIEKFNTGTLSENEWKHPGHLRLALWYCFHGKSFSEKLYKIRCALITYATKTNPDYDDCALRYNETKTGFWIQQIGYFIDKNPKKDKNLSNEAYLDELDLLLTESKLMNSQLVYEFYSKELLETFDAKAGFKKPDLKQF